MSNLLVRPASALRGTLTVPGDKSISHRALILAAIADGQSVIEGFLQAEDTLHTALALEAMGIEIAGLNSKRVMVGGLGLKGLRVPLDPIYLGNSGTSMRLLAGLVAGCDFAATFSGDESLSRRPMDRIAQPLGMMGASVTGQGERCLPPIAVRGGKLRPIAYHTPVASAQIKSAILLAGLHADGTTIVTEPSPSRDHTERTLAQFGAKIETNGLNVRLQGPGNLKAQQVKVPGDISSAAYFLTAAQLVPDSQVTITQVGLNPTRTGLLEVLSAMGASLQVTSEIGRGEPAGQVVASSAPLCAGRVGGELLPRMIDEVPLFCVAAALADGVSEVTDAAELRVKESDRLAAMAAGLRRLGAEVEEREDGMLIRGGRPLKGAVCECYQDHRVAMSLAIAGLAAEGETVIRNADCIATSFPGFADCLRSLGAEVEWKGGQP